MCTLIISNFKSPSFKYFDTIVSDLLLGAIINLNINEYYVLNSIYQLLDIDIGISNNNSFIYNFDVYSEDSIVFIKSIPNIKALRCKIIVISENLSQSYFKKLYLLGVDLIIQPSTNYDDDIEKILSEIITI